jgi:hypothetical protein
MQEEHDLLLLVPGRSPLSAKQNQQSICISTEADLATFRQAK